MLKQTLMQNLGNKKLLHCRDLSPPLAFAEPTGPQVLTQVLQDLDARMAGRSPEARAPSACLSAGGATVQDGPLTDAEKSDSLILSKVPPLCRQKQFGVGLRSRRCLLCKPMFIVHIKSYLHACTRVIFMCISTSQDRDMICTCKLI